MVVTFFEMDLKGEKCKYVQKLKRAVPIPGITAQRN
jgi:hypothetical protein